MAHHLHRARLGGICSASASSTLDTVKSKAHNEFKGRLLKNDSDALYELKRQIESLVEHPGWMLVQELIETRIGEIQRLTESGLHEHVEYAIQIGEVRGMRVSQAAAEAVIDAAVEREAEDKQLHAQMAGRGE